jgi:hypothetical protein
MMCVLPLIRFSLALSLSLAFDENGSSQRAKKEDNDDDDDDGNNGALVLRW